MAMSGRQYQRRVRPSPGSHAASVSRSVDLGELAGPEVQLEVLLRVVVADDVDRRGRAAVLDLELGSLDVEVVAGVLGLDRSRHQMAVAIDREVVEREPEHGG